ncbi:hypothetical protein [Aggregatibacter actinomycetemcomitans]|uniref:hypothetical protein n=1 Tax=Aggregatibacter actinomycetemcomitans TaxID=714 RepID=UPI0021CCA6EF|nr:hypothetical protein [Aggregatibacter actinomycetemcomitans]
MKDALFMRLLRASAIGNTFNYYQIKALPEDTGNIPIMLTEFEKEGFRENKWLETRENMAEYILETYPQIFSMQEREQLGRVDLSSIKNKRHRSLV